MLSVPHTGVGTVPHTSVESYDTQTRALGVAGSRDAPRPSFVFVGIYGIGLPYRHLAKHDPVTVYALLLGGIGKTVVESPSETVYASAVGPSQANISRHQPSRAGRGS